MVKSECPEKLKLNLEIYYRSSIMPFDASIPVVDMLDYSNPEKHDSFIQSFSKALQTVGFVAVVNSNVSPQILDRAYAAAREFYAKDTAFKMRAHAPELNGQRGYVPSEQAQGSAKKDHKEFYHLSRDYPAEILAEYGYPANIWPDDGEFKNSMLALVAEIDKYSTVVEAAIAECIGKAPDFFSDMTNQGGYVMRSIYYPANPPPDTVWAAQHTDIDLFTILPRATEKGLQVQDDGGKWLDVIVPDGAIIINAGDMLRNITNGFFKSAVHRVISMGKEERYSVVAFLHPRPHDRLDPLPEFVAKDGVRKYANVTARELLFERLIELGLHSPWLLKTFAESGAIERLKEVNRVSPRVLQTLREAGFLNDEQAAAPASPKRLTNRM
jgi:isopenicillin N synthase-like dioxygenase